MNDERPKSYFSMNPVSREAVPFVYEQVVMLAEQFGIQVEQVTHFAYQPRIMNSPSFHVTLSPLEVSEYRQFDDLLQTRLQEHMPKLELWIYFTPAGATPYGERHRAAE